MPDQSTPRICLALFALALALPVFGQAQVEQLYRVELLVFSRPAGAGAEHWDGLPELAYPSNSRFLVYPGEQPTSESSTSIPDRSAPPAGEEALPGPAQATTFATLPPSERQLSGSAAAMQRSGRYRVLFHEAWIQPMSSQSQALPIILDRSGDGGPWPELQGSVKLYLSRYFYLDTNLWLNTRGEYLPGNWQMPAPPLAPASRPPQTSSYSTLHRGSVATIPDSPDQSTPGDLAQTNPGLQALGPTYPFRHAVRLKQTRRMRSGELVYIDHPLLGVLIRVTPLQSATAGTPDAAAPG